MIQEFVKSVWLREHCNCLLFLLYSIENGTVALCMQTVFPTHPLNLLSGNPECDTG